MQQLNTTITGRSAVPVGIQFGAYAAFLSFFGLSQLPTASVNFTGIVDYAAAMAFELVTNATVSSSSYPAAGDISVRFLYTNQSAALEPLVAYPLFGQSETVLPWSTFVSEMDKISVGTQEDWCSACGETTGVCASTSTATSSGSGSASTGGSGGSGSGGMSKAVAGVIGAFVTLAVILGLEGLVLLVGGYRLAKKGAKAGSPQSSVVAGAKA